MRSKILLNLLAILVGPVSVLKVTTFEDNPRRIVFTVQVDPNHQAGFCSIEMGQRRICVLTKTLLFLPQKVLQKYFQTLKLNHKGVSGVVFWGTLKKRKKVG